MAAVDILTRLVDQQLAAPASSWFAAALQTAAQGTTSELLKLYTAAARHVGSSAAADSARPDAHADADMAEATSSLAQWTLTDAARASLLMTRATAAPTVFAPDAVACFEQGDAGEQISWLRSVALLPAPERFLALVVDACRTNIVPLFEAIACENAYPSRYFPERNWNQLVMKALFNNIRLARIVGLADRSNAELSRMAADFSAERRAAGRSVPPDIDLAMEGARQQGVTP